MIGGTLKINTGCKLLNDLCFTGAGHARENIKRLIGAVVHQILVEKSSQRFEAAFNLWAGNANIRQPFATQL